MRRSWYSLEEDFAATQKTSYTIPVFGKNQRSVLCLLKLYLRVMANTSFFKKLYRIIIAQNGAGREKEGL